jgi:hypothetical protein
VEGPFRRGEVVWGLDPFKRSETGDPEPERPFLVLNNDTHPFAHRQFAGVALSATPREAALALAPDDWYVGGLPAESYVYPWLLVTRDHADVATAYGRLQPTVVEDAFDALVGYLSPDE